MLTMAGGPDRDYRCVRPTFRLIADMDFMDFKACGDEVLTHGVHGPGARGRDCVREWFPGGTIEESEKNAASRLRATGKLAKNERQFSWLEMDQRIPSEDAGQMSIRNFQRAQRRHSKACGGKPPSRLFDEKGNQIDALNLNAVVREECRPVPRAAAGVDG
jgi:hypothetical protein